jgi:hypothetical protein
MVARSQTSQDRTRRRVAASYRKDGYKVSVLPRPDALPPFLAGSAPDVIAERADDRVVVEIKQAGFLKGANDLVDLAQRVDAQAGWRLELVTFKGRDPDADIASPEWLDQMLRRPSDDTFACYQRYEVLGFLIRSTALSKDIPVRGKTIAAIAEELAFEGWIGPSLAARTGNAAGWQAELLRGHTPSPSAAEQAAELENLCRDILAQTPTPED